MNSKLFNYLLVNGGIQRLIFNFLDAQGSLKRKGLKCMCVASHRK